MGISCCTSRDTYSESALLDQVRGQMDGTYKSRVDMKPIVNMLGETEKLSEMMSNMNSIKKSDAAASESDADKLDLKVELLLQHLKQDLKLLKRKHKHFDSKEFQTNLLVLIGANTREISKLVITAYKPRRMSALNRLLTSSCRIGPKMDHSKAGASRSRTDDSLSEVKSSKSKKSNSALKPNQAFATE